MIAHFPLQRVMRNAFIESERTMCSVSRKYEAIVDGGARFMASGIISLFIAVAVSPIGAGGGGLMPPPPKKIKINK